MGTTTDKINAILNTKGNMKKKFNEKGVPVDDSVPFSEYPDKMDELSSGSSSTISNEIKSIEMFHAISNKIVTCDSLNFQGISNTNIEIFINE